MNEQEFITLLDRLKRLNGESEISEFKVNNTDMQRLGDNLSALANSASLHKADCAYLIFGVSDDGKIVGTNFKKGKHKGQDLKIWLSTQLNPSVSFAVESLLVKNKPIVVFTIQPAKRYPVKFKGKASIRIGSSTRPLTNFPEIESNLWETLSHRGIETDIVEGSFSRQEILEKLDFSSYYKLKDMDPLANQSGLALERMADEQLIQKAGTKFAVTKLGAILLAKNIEEFNGLERKIPRLTVYDGSNKAKPVAQDKTYKTGLVTSLLELLKDVNQQLPRKETFDQGLRKEVAIYPKKALRELIINAIIHQDLNLRGSGPMVDIFNDRVEISNPGSPLIPTKRFIGSIPRSRNERLAREMRLLGFCEERGTGVTSAVDLCEIYQLPAPEFRADDQDTVVTIYGPKKFTDLSKIDRRRTAYLHTCLKFISNERMTNKSLRKRFNISESNYPQVSRVIQDTIAAGLIQFEDPASTSGRNARYIPFWADQYNDENQ